MTRTQLDLERQLVAWLEAGAESNGSGSAGDWTLSLEGDLVVLQPQQQRWVAYDSVHGGFADLGVGAGEAILVPTSAGPAAKRALRPGEEGRPLGERVEIVGSRLLAVCDGQLAGPLDHGELWAFWYSRPQSTLRVWRPFGLEWTDGLGHFGASPFER